MYPTKEEIEKRADELREAKEELYRQQIAINKQILKAEKEEKALKAIRDMIRIDDTDRTKKQKTNEVNENEF